MAYDEKTSINSSFSNTLRKELLKLKNRMEQKNDYSDYIILNPTISTLPNNRLRALD